MANNFTLLKITAIAAMIAISIMITSRVRDISIPPHSDAVCM
ncbi:hypothetical protein BLGI_52 [Brevibacillus laterosporus GI-9]|nr:hypothetical protein BLGI_52 [Brevibacillus laterosporus GI-9]